MFTEITAWIKSAEAGLWAAAVVALIGWHLWTVHEAKVTARAEVYAADATARADEDKKIAAQEATMKAQADQAEKTRESTQTAFDSYVSAHPVGAVLMCSPPSDHGQLPSGTPQNGGAAGAGTGPASVPKVPAGSRDIGPALDTIVQAAGRLAILYQDAQSQPEVKP